MFKRIIQWARARNAEYTAQAEARGFAWAASELVDGYDPATVAGWIDRGEVFDARPHAFDRGARRAVNAWAAMQRATASRHPPTSCRPFVAPVARVALRRAIAQAPGDPLPVREAVFSDNADNTSPGEHAKFLAAWIRNDPIPGPKGRLP